MVTAGGGELALEAPVVLDVAEVAVGGRPGAGESLGVPAQLTFHPDDVADPECLVAAGEVKHRPVGAPSTTISAETTTRGWFPVDGPLTVTACSTEEENCDQYSKCSVRDPLWKIKERILKSLETCSISELAADTPEPVLIPLSRQVLHTHS